MIDELFKLQLHENQRDLQFREFDIAPPLFKKDNECSYSGKTFTNKLRRYHCRACGRSICKYYVASEPHNLIFMGYQQPENVCKPCKVSLQRKDLLQRVQWRQERFEVRT